MTYRYIPLKIKYFANKGFRVKNTLTNTYCSKTFFKKYEDAEKQKYAIEQRHAEQRLQRHYAKYGKKKS